MKSLAKAAVIGAALLQFGTVDAEVLWLCSISSEQHQLVCVADHDPTAPAVAQPAATTAVVNGTRFPLDPGRRYVVDLWSPPTDSEFTQLLAQSTICYRSPDCTAWLYWADEMAHAQRPVRRR
jgi:hypothetical protein